MGSTSPRLTVLGGPMAGKELTIEDVVDNVLIGSDSSCRFCLDLPEISPIHARLWVDPQGITVYDTNAPQGLFINDDRVTGQAPLRNGDILWLGTPGQEGVVMIQCRIPSRGQAAKASASSATTDEATQVVAPSRAGAPDDTTPPPPPPLVMPQETESTVVLGGPALERMASPPDDDVPQTVVMHDVPMEESGFVPLSPEPEQAPVDAPPDLGQAPLPEFQPIPPEPTYDEAYLEPTVMDAPAATAWVPPPAEPPMATTVLPPVAATFEDEIEPVRLTPAPPARVPQPPPPPPEAPRAVAPPAPRPAPAPRPVTATPRPPAPAARVAQPQRQARPSSSGSTGKLVAAAALLLVLGGGGGAAWYFLLGPGAARPTTAPPPPPSAAPATAEPVQPTPPPTVEPTPEPSPIEPSDLPTLAPPTPTPGASPSGKPSPSPSPTKSPKATPTPVAATPNAADLRAQQVTTLVAQAEAALGEKRFDAAAALFDQALQLDPQNSAASRGKAGAQAGLAAARRSFVPGRSQLSGAKSDKKLTGFDSEDVSLSKAPDYSGRLEFETSPKSPRAGESYVVRVFLINDGKKAFKVQTFSATTTTNGSASGGPMAPTTREFQPQQRAVLQELSGVWRDDTVSWALDVQVQSQHGETVKSQLSWR